MSFWLSGSRARTGCRLHARKAIDGPRRNQDFDVADERVARVVEHATRHRLPVLFDSFSPFDADQPGKFVRLALAQPDARIVLAHMHFTKFRELLVYDVLARYSHWQRNVWFEMSATVCLLADSPSAGEFAWVCRKLGVDRLLSGSDFPMDDPVESLDSLATYAFAQSELRLMCHDNAVQLLGLDS